MQWWQILLTILGSITGVAIIVGVFVAGSRNNYRNAERNNYVKAVDSYKILLDAKGEEIRQLKQETKELRNLHSESMREIGKMQGQVDAYSKLPLKELSQNQHTITKVQLLIAKHMGVEGIDAILKEFNGHDGKPIDSVI